MPARTRKRYSSEMAPALLLRDPKAQVWRPPLRIEPLRHNSQAQPATSQRLRKGHTTMPEWPNLRPSSNSSWDGFEHSVGCQRHDNEAMTNKRPAEYPRFRGGGGGISINLMATPQLPHCADKKISFSYL